MLLTYQVLQFLLQGYDLTLLTDNNIPTILLAYIICITPAVKVLPLFLYFIISLQFNYICFNIKIYNTYEYLLNIKYYFFIIINIRYGWHAFTPSFLHNSLLMIEKFNSCMSCSAQFKAIFCVVKHLMLC